jgi:hypothetical protein
MLECVRAMWSPVRQNPASTPPGVAAQMSTTSASASTQNPTSTSVLRSAESPRQPMGYASDACTSERVVEGAQMRAVGCLAAAGVSASN